MKLVWCLLVASSALINFSASLEHVYQIHPPAQYRSAYAVPAVPAPIYYTNPPVVVNTVNDVVYAQKYSDNTLPYYSEVDTSDHGITFAAPNAHYSRTFHGNSNLRKSQSFAPSSNENNQRSANYENNQPSANYDNNQQSANYENNQRSANFDNNQRSSSANNGNNQKSANLMLEKGNSVTINSPTVRLTHVTSQKSRVGSRTDLNNQQSGFVPRSQPFTQQSNYGPPQNQQNRYPAQQSANYDYQAGNNQFVPNSQNVVVNQGPTTKTRKYEVRRPAIQKQFYDIEEHIIVRPVGTALVELDQPTSNTHKGSGQGQKSSFTEQRFDNQQDDQNPLSQEENDRHQKFHDEQAKILQRQQMIQQQQIQQSQRLQAEQQAEQYEQLQKLQEQQIAQQQNLQSGNNDGFDDGQYRPDEENNQGPSDYNENPENFPQYQANQYPQNQNTQNYRPASNPQYVQSQKQQFRPQNTQTQQFVEVRPQNQPQYVQVAPQYIQSPPQYVQVPQNQVFVQNPPAYQQPPVNQRPNVPQNTQQGFYPSSTPSQGFYPSSTPSQGFYPSTTPSYDQNDNSQGNGPYDDAENDSVVVEARSNPDCPPKNNTQTYQRTAYVQPARNQTNNNTLLRSGNGNFDSNDGTTYNPANNTSSVKTFKVETSTRITLEDDDVEEDPENIKNVQINDETNLSKGRNNQDSNQRAQDVGATRGDISSRQSYSPQQPPFQSYPQERDFPLDSRAEFIPGRSAPPPTYNPQPPTYNPQPPTYNPQPPTYNPQPPTYNPQPPTYNPQPPTYNPQPPTYNPQPPVFYPRPNYAPQPRPFYPRPNYVPQVFIPRQYPQQPNYEPQPSPKPQPFIPPTISPKPQPTPQKPVYVNNNRPHIQPTVPRSNPTQDPKDVNVQVNVQTRSGGESRPIIQVQPSRSIITTDLEEKINNEENTIVISKQNTPEEAHDNQRHYIRLLTERKNVAEIGFGNRQADEEEINAGRIRGRVISATPSPNSQPTKEHVNTRRIVISRPVETVQEIDVIEHETSVTPKPHGQPPIYTTSGPPAFGK